MFIRWRLNRMPRLREEQVKEIGRELNIYDASLVKKIGLSLKEIGMRAVGITGEELKKVISSNTVAVIPITWGEGVIEGFVEAIQQILNYINAKAFRTANVNIGGLAEAIEKKADIVFCADDNAFVAINLNLKRVIYNTEATARGYVTALELLVGTLNGREVLVIGGAGKVGWNAILFLKEKRAKIFAFDLDQKKMVNLLEGYDIVDIVMERDFKKALSRHNIIFDASPAAGIIQVEDIKPDTFIAAPGIPLGLSEEAYFSVKDRLIHDSLQIGTVTMFMESIYSSLNLGGGSIERIDADSKSA